MFNRVLSRERLLFLLLLGAAGGAGQSSPTAVTPLTALPTVGAQAVAPSSPTAPRTIGVQPPPETLALTDGQDLFTILTEDGWAPA